MPDVWLYCRGGDVSLRFKVWGLTLFQSIRLRKPVSFVDVKDSEDETRILSGVLLLSRRDLYIIICSLRTTFTIQN